MKHRPTKHEFKATVRLLQHAPQIEPMSGRMVGKEPTHAQLRDKTLSQLLESWSIQPVSDHLVTLTFWALDGSDVVGVANRIMQRYARGRPDVDRPNKRLRFTAADYVLVDLVHPSTGKYDLPTGTNPCMKPKARGKDMTMELAL